MCVCVCVCVCVGGGGGVGGWMGAMRVKACNFLLIYSFFIYIS